MSKELQPYGWAIVDSRGREVRQRARLNDLFGSEYEAKPFDDDEVARQDRDFPGCAPHRVVTLYPEEVVETLREAVADQMMRDTLMTGLATQPGGITVGLEGGAAALLAEMLAAQYRDTNAANYIELSFTSRHSVPGERFVVTVQRVGGVTPAQRVREADEGAKKADQALVKAQGKIESALNCHPQAVRHLLGEAWDEIGRARGAVTTS